MTTTQNAIDMKVLNLTLNAKWYDMIEAGIKKEEYREIKDFWKVRLMEFEYRDRGNVSPFKEWIGFKQFDAIRFARGGHFHPSIPQITFKCEGIEIATGNTEWGAEKGKEYFVIKIGERI